MTNKNNNVLYTGVTKDLARRVYEHKNKLNKGFTSRYNINKLVFYEMFDDITDAIEMEKKIKGGSRLKKIKLIEGMNAVWEDLYDSIL
ncbi:MAG: GIY-YIG nuclease family protein [Spirochaetes bacterium]|nr:GIY-YIG nuclease family protein [Spirochaetota bacterium]